MDKTRVRTRIRSKTHKKSRLRKTTIVVPTSRLPVAVPVRSFNSLFKTTRSH
jgi:hypothetical protein